MELEYILKILGNFIKHIHNNQPAKITNKAYGWKDDTILIFKEEIDKHMFYVCLDNKKQLSKKRSFLYYLKPNSVDMTLFANKDSIKINVDILEPLFDLNYIKNE